MHIMLLCLLPLTAGVVSQSRLPLLAGAAPTAALARRAPLARTSMLSSDDLDELIEDVTKMKTSALIIRPYDSEGTWLWSQWSGSLLQLTWQKIIGIAVIATANCLVLNVALQADLLTTHYSLLTTYYFVQVEVCLWAS